MKHKVLFIISLISIISLALSCVCFSYTKYQLDTSQDEYVSIKEKNKHIITDVDAEIVKLKEQNSNAAENYKRISSAKGVDQIAEDYYYSRYSFNGSPEANKQRIINEVRNISTMTFRDTLKLELSKSGGNGNVSEDFKHTCSVKSIFITDVYTKDNNNLGKNSKIYMLDVYAKLRINNSYEAISVLTFALNSEKWKIMDERIIATIFDNF